MGVINPENNLKFKSSDALFARIKKRLNSFDAQGLIDEGDFHKHVMYILEQLGQAVFVEGEAVLHVKDFKARLPHNFKYLHAAYRCTFRSNGPKTINEQKPYFYYHDTEITRDCPKSCTFQCHQEFGRTKIVIRTFVNGEDSFDGGTCNKFQILKLSPNVKERCTEHCVNLLHAGKDEITLKDNHVLTMFPCDTIYMQYFGIPIDEETGLPMIPENEYIEKAIEYYIYTQLFEEFYWNTTVPGIANMLQDARVQYDFHIGMARYWAKLPTFAKMVNAIRRQRSNRKFYYFAFDKTNA